MELLQCTLSLCKIITVSYIRERELHTTISRTRETRRRRDRTRLHDTRDRRWRLRHRSPSSELQRLAGSSAPFLLPSSRPCPALSSSQLSSMSCPLFSSFATRLPRSDGAISRARDSSSAYDVSPMQVFGVSELCAFLGVSHCLAEEYEALTGSRSLAEL